MTKPPVAKCLVWHLLLPTVSNPDSPSILSTNVWYNLSTVSQSIATYVNKRQTSMCTIAWLRLGKEGTIYWSIIMYINSRQMCALTFARQRKCDAFGTVVPHQNGLEPIKDWAIKWCNFSPCLQTQCSILVELIIHKWKRWSLPCGAWFIGRVIQAFWTPICWQLHWKFCWMVEKLQLRYMKFNLGVNRNQWMAWSH